MGAVTCSGVSHEAGFEGADDVLGDGGTWVGLNVPTECGVEKRKMNLRMPKHGVEIM